MQEYQGDKISIGLPLIIVQVSFIKTNEWEHSSQKQNGKEGMLLVSLASTRASTMINSSLDWEADREKACKRLC